MKKQKVIFKGKKTKNNLSIQRIQLFIFIFELFLLSGILFLLIQSQLAPRYISETLSTEVRNLPNDIQQSMLEEKSEIVYRVPILMYHYVEYVQDKNDTFRQTLNIEPHIFEEQVKTLKDEGYSFLTAKDLGEIINGNAVLPEKPIVITFDDGHWDLYTDVLPILKKHNIKITAYIIPGFIGDSDFLDDKQLQGIIDSGLVDIGAHTMHHLSLTSLSESEKIYQLQQSKKLLEEKYNLRIETFAYPFGSFDLETTKLVEKSGYSLALSTVPGVEQSTANKYFLYRLRPGRRIGMDLISWLSQDQFSAFATNLP